MLILIILLPLVLFPLLVLMGTYLLQIKSLIMNPELAVDKGFWIAAKTSSMYSYEVAKEVRRLRKKPSISIIKN